MIELLTGPAVAAHQLDPSGERPLKMAKELRRRVLREAGRRNSAKLRGAAQEHFGLPDRPLALLARAPRQLPWRAPEGSAPTPRSLVDRPATAERRRGRPPAGADAPPRGRLLPARRSAARCCSRFPTDGSAPPRPPSTISFLPAPSAPGTGSPRTRSGTTTPAGRCGCTGWATASVGSTAASRRRWCPRASGRRPSRSAMPCSAAALSRPGFDFADFRMADRDALIESYPADAELIRRLAR